jgi:hypothetical protein
MVCLRVTRYHVLINYFNYVKGGGGLGIEDNSNIRYGMVGPGNSCNP